MNKFNKKKFKLDIQHFMLSLKDRFSFENLGFLPRWLVLLLDLMIVIFSGVTTYFLLRGIKLTYIPNDYLAYGVLLYFSINVFFFWIFRTYSGIIRHSSFIDAVKIFFAQFCTLITLISVNFVFLLDHDFKIFLSKNFASYKKSIKFVD